MTENTTGENGDPVYDLAAEMDEAAEMIVKFRTASPEAASAFVQMLDRIRSDTSWASVTAKMEQMAEGNSIGNILRHQALAMEEMRASFERPVTLLPDFTGSNFRRLEKAVISLLPATVEEVHEVERAAAEASVDPTHWRLVSRLSEHLPNSSEIVNMTSWAGFFTVSAYLIKMAPKIDPNTVAMLGVIVAVWAVLVQRSRP